MKLWVSASLIVLSLTLPLSQAYTERVPDPVPIAVQNRALSFLADAVGLDVIKYNITLTLNESWHFDPTAPSAQSLRYNLSCKESVLDVMFDFTENTWFYFGMYNISGPPLFVHPANNVLEEAKAILGRYQNQKETKDEGIGKMLYMLNSINTLEPMKIVMANLTLKITENDFGPSFTWTDTVGGISNSYNQLYFSFFHGFLNGFSDTWTRYAIPEPQINVSKEEAINRTKEHGAQYAIDKEIVYGDPILYDKAVAELSFQPREDGMLYPQWAVGLPFEKKLPPPFSIRPDNPQYYWFKFFYDNEVSYYYANYSMGIYVAMWADTGEVAGVYNDRIYTKPKLSISPEELPTIVIPADAVPPNISNVSPENKTYNTTNVLLRFNVNETPSWMGYSLDQQRNITITGNTTLNGLHEGTHGIAVFANDTFGNMGASDVVNFVVDTTPPVFAGLPLENVTYGPNSLQLNFTVNEGTSWIGCSLDGQANTTIMGNTTFTGLPAGTHNVTVYANDTAGNMGSSGTVHFLISDPFPTAWVAGATSLVVVGSILIVFYIKKRKPSGRD